MRKSELILPLRIYDDVYDQRRYHRHCAPDVCDQELIFPTNELPLFQFTRASSLNQPSALTLRSVCNEPSLKIVPEGADTFGATAASDDFWGTFPKTNMYNDGFTQGHLNVLQRATDCVGIENGNLSNTGIPGYTETVAAKLVIPGVGSGLKYRLKIVVDKFEVASGLTIDIKKDTGTLIQAISTPGIHIVDFEADWSGDLWLVFEDPENGDEWRISFVQLTCLSPTLLAFTVNDVVLDETDLAVIPLLNETDVIVFCQSPNVDWKPEPGDYYYIIEFGDEIYYSEIFRLRPMAELEKTHYELRWQHTSDISGRVIYKQGAHLSCEFYNRLFLSAEIFAPEYETVVDLQENGLGEKNPVLKRWQKSIKLDIRKSPPFLTDALSAVMLHDTVTLRSPLNQQQDVRPDAEEIDRVECDIDDVLQNCYQAVIMTLFLPPSMTGATCEEVVEEFACGTLTPPVLDSVTPVIPGVVYVVTGSAGKPGAFAVVQYNKNSAGWVNSSVSAMFDEDGETSIVFPIAEVGGGITDLDVRIYGRAYYCDYGASNSIDVI